MKKTFKTRLEAFEHYLWHIAKLLGLCAFIILLSRFFIIAPGRVDGPSMEPTFLDEDLFFVNKFTYLFDVPQRFDIIQIVDPDSKKLIMKRIVALPGETVEVKRGGIYIKKTGSEGDAIMLDESVYLDDMVFTKLKGQQGIERFDVGEYEFFVLGDNRLRSVDSRYYGPIHRTKIVGKIF